ncbi:MAG TPA: hypothetical protein VF246_00240 [Acidimicrobiia bacterium]
MFSRLGRNRPCEHPEVVTTRNYGLVRVVCRRCGMVHIEAVLGGTREPEDRDQVTARSA